MTYRDQALEFHKVDGSNRRYELTGLRTGNIRDQMVRAAILVTRLLEAQVIKRDDPSHGLLVLGGGAAGATAALLALDEGVHVVLVERKRNPFSTQLRVTSRIVDPVEFDWPHDHWDKGVMRNLNSFVMPLKFRRGKAAVVASRWLFALQKVVKASRQAAANGTRLAPGAGRLRLYSHSDAHGLVYNEVGSHLDVTPWPPQSKVPGKSQHFGAAISCIGFSGEKVTAPTGTGSQYGGYPFWSRDPLAKPLLGVRRADATTRPVQVLVSGGGDGAQQDFLRALTGDFGLALLDKINKHVTIKPDAQSRLAMLQSEDEFRRVHAWRAPNSTPAAAMQAWHDLYAQEVNVLWGKLPPATRNTLADRVLKAGVQATWLIGQAHPTFSYALNRFLALLMAEVHAWDWQRRHASNQGGRPACAVYDPDLHESGEHPVVIRKWRVETIRGHGCKSVPSRCHGLAHDVWIEPHPHQPGSAVSLGLFDVIVLRHGVDQKPLFGAAPVPEQFVPFEVPC